MFRALIGWVIFLAVIVAALISTNSAHYFIDAPSPPDELDPAEKELAVSNIVKIKQSIEDLIILKIFPFHLVFLI